MIKDWHDEVCYVFIKAVERERELNCKEGKGLCERKRVEGEKQGLRGGGRGGGGGGGG